MSDKMSCGHEYRYISRSDERTNFCVWCEWQATVAALAQAEGERDACRDAMIAANDAADMLKSDLAQAQAERDAATRRAERAADVMKRLAAGERLANVPGRYLNATLRRLYVVNMPMQYRLVLEHTPKGFQPYMEGLMSHELFNKRTSRTQAAG